MSLPDEINIECKEALELMRDEGYLYLDVRTPEEFAAGHPEGAYNVPVMVRTPTGQMNPNPQFVGVVEKNFEKDAKIVIGCQAGARSRMAAELLWDAGYENLRNAAGGWGGGQDALGNVYQGWKDTGLPVAEGVPEGRGYEALKK